VIIMVFLKHFASISRPFIRVDPPVLFTFTRTKSESQLDTPEELPTSEPSDPQITYTFSSSDIQVSPSLRSSRILAMVFVSGKNTGSTTTVYFKWLKNGSEVKSASKSVGNNYYYTAGYSYISPEDGDVLGLKVWASASGVNWYWKGYATDIEYLDFGFDWFFLFPVETEHHPEFSLGDNPYNIAYQQYKYFRSYNPEVDAFYFDNYYLESYLVHPILFSPHPDRGHGSLYSLSGGTCTLDTSSYYSPWIRGNEVYKKVIILPVSGFEW